MEGQVKMPVLQVLNPAVVRNLHVGRSGYRTLTAGGEMKECPSNACAVPVSVRSPFPRAQLLLLSLWV